MRLHINFVPVIVTILALMTVVGLREESWPRFVAEYNQPIYTPPAPPTPPVGYGPGSVDSLPPYPGCFGDGCGALQSYREDGIRHKRVTNLNSSGAGSYNAAITAVCADSNMVDKPLDYITFEVSGTIFPGTGGSSCIMRGLYINALNAPGPVHFYWPPWQLNEGSEDVVVRGISIRGIGGNSAQLVLRVYGHRVHIADNSFSHFAHRGLSAYSDTLGTPTEPYCTRYWSFARNLISYKGQRAHIDGELDSADYSDPPTLTMASGLPRQKNCTTDGGWYQNAILGGPGTYRFANVNGRDIRVHQNLIYNGGGNAWGGSSNFYFVDRTYNFFVGGPSSGSYPGSRKAYPMYTDSAGACSDSEKPGTPCPDSTKSLYANKNHHDLSGDGSFADTALTQDSIWRGSERQIVTWTLDTASAPLAHRRTTPLTNAVIGPLDTLEMSHATLQSILDNAGATKRIDSLGDWFVDRDETDARARLSVMDTTEKREAGDFNRDSFIELFMPDYSSGTWCRDDDNDGICDAWELRAASTTSIDPDSLMPSGYYFLELWGMGGITNADTVIGVAPPPDPDEIPAIPGGVGEGAPSLQTCRDSVLNGSWGPPVIHVVRGTSYDSAFADGGIMDILQNDLSDTKLDIVMFSEAGGMVNVQDTAGAPDRYMLNIDNSCVIVTGVNSPGDGVVFRTNLPDRDMLFRIGRYNTVSDILVGDIRVWADSGTGSHVPPFAAGGDSRLLYIHHNSFHHGQDQIGLGASHATFAFNIVANISDGHNGATETLWMTQWEPDDGPDSTIAQSYIGNLLAHHMWRIPSLKAEGSVSADSAREYTGRWKWTNNISWKYADAGDEISHFAGGVELDITNSIFAYFKDASEPSSFTPISWLKCIDLNNTNSDCTSDGGPAGWLSPASVRISGSQYRELGVVEATDYDMARSFNNEVLPDSIKRGSAISDPDFPYTPLTADQAHDSLTSLSVRYGVGASRQLSCSGVLSARRDLTDAEIIGHYVASDSTTEEEMRNSWGSSYVVRDSMTDAGTPCADTDGDKLPDAYEKLALDDPNDSTSLTTVDVAPNTGHLAIEMYLEGYSFDASGDPDPPEPGGPARTYGDTRGAYLVPLVVETDTIGSGVDTMIVQRYVPDRDSVPLGYAYSYYIVSGRDSILLLTYDTITEIGYGVRDSAAVDSILADMGFSQPPYPWAVWVPGAP